MCWSTSFIGHPNPISRSVSDHTVFKVNTCRAVPCRAMSETMFMAVGTAAGVAAKQLVDGDANVPTQAAYTNVILVDV